MDEPEKREITIIGKTNWHNQNKIFGIKDKELDKIGVDSVTVFAPAPP